MRQDPSPTGRQTPPAPASKGLASRRQSLPLTIIVPVHDRPRDLARALASIASQSLWPREIIVVDDGSAVPVDPSIGGAGGPAIRVIRHEANRGAAAARNTGLRAASSDWITFLDSDDHLLGGSLELRWRLVEEALRKDANEKAVFGCGWVDFSGADAIGMRLPRPGRALQDYASGCWYAPGSCIILHREAAMAAGGVQDESLRRYEDVDWFLSLALAGFRLVVLPVVAAAVRRHRTTSPDRAEEAAARLMEKWRGRLSDPALLRRLDSYMELEIAAAHRHAGAWPAAAMHLARSLALMPRLTLQLSPGWHRRRTSVSPTHSVSWQKP